MEMPVSAIRSSSDKKCQLSIELVIGEHHRSSVRKSTAFTKWCPAENGIKTFEQAEDAVDLALSRMGQKSIVLMQCISPQI